MTRNPFHMSCSLAAHTNSPATSYFQPLSWIEHDYTLNANRIDVWQYALDMPWKEAFIGLDLKEQHRAQRYHFQRHQRRFTIGRAILRLILSRYLQCDPKQIVFKENTYGKPELLDPMLPIHFNLSHSRELALLAIGHTHSLGIDLEYFSSRPLTGMSQMMFSTNELHHFSQVISNNRVLSFFHIWAQKEALIKANGMGLSYPLKDFSVSHLPPTHQTIFDPVDQRHWQMHSFMPTIACCAALCYHPTIQNLRYTVLGNQDHAFTR